MNEAAKQVNAENKKKKIYSCVLTNQITIVAWKLFKSDRVLHFGFILYRLRRDFGMTAWEIANLTGIPTRYVYKYIERVKPIIKSGVLKNLAESDYKGQLEAWNDEPLRPNKPQGYYFFKEYPAWYENGLLKKWNIAPNIAIGNTEENDKTKEK